MKRTVVDVPVNRAVDRLAGVTCLRYAAIMILEKLPGAQALTSDEKWSLMAELWLELSAGLESAPVRPEHLVLLEQRFADYLARPELARRWEEVRQRLAESKREWK